MLFKIKCVSWDELLKAPEATFAEGEHVFDKARRGSQIFPLNVLQHHAYEAEDGNDEASKGGSPKVKYSCFEK